MNFIEKITELLKESFPVGSKIQVSDMTGTNDHLEIFVQSKIFNELPLVKQHQVVMDILKEKFNEGLHAVKIKTLKDS